MTGGGKSIWSPRSGDPHRCQNYSNQNLTERMKLASNKLLEDAGAWEKHGCNVIGMCRGSWITKGFDLLPQVGERLMKRDSGDRRGGIRPPGMKDFPGTLPRASGESRLRSSD